MDKLKLHSKDITAENIAKLAALFPNCVTETKAEDGSLKNAIDFDLLRQELSVDLVEGAQERYRLDWPGKREALATANAPIAKTLRPCREESVDFDATRNLFIEGDNLETLKLLQETYLNKVKVIYIDPPYNTGNDFIYDDDFSEDADEYFIRSGQSTDQGERLIANNESNGRFHSDWLTTIYPRLKVARNLLTDDGIIFISINDVEIQNLKKICSEIFGDSNFLAQLVWRTDGNFDNQAKFKSCHEYILVYARNEPAFPLPPVIDPNVPKTSKLYNKEIRNTVVKNGPANPVSPVTLPKGFPADFDEGVISERSDAWPHYNSPAHIEKGKLSTEITVSSGWSSKDLLLEFIENKCNPILDAKSQKTVFTISRTGAIEAIKERSENQSHVITTITGLGGSQRAAQELEDLGVIFDDYPKPTDLIQYLIRMNEGRDFIVLDFYAGSGTTAHAVMNLNAGDFGSRQHVTVQLPQPCPSDSKAFKAGYKTIAEIGKERIRRAGAKIRAGLEAQREGELPGSEQHTKITAKLANLDIGFRVLKASSSNMADVYYRPDEVTQDGLGIQVENIKPDRTPEDLLFQVLLDWGVDLASPIRMVEDGKLKVEGKEYTVFVVGDNDLVACFDAGVTEALIKEVAKIKPLRAVFRDASFATDATKINIEQIFKALSPHTELKAI